MNSLRSEERGVEETGREDKDGALSHRGTVCFLIF